MSQRTVHYPLGGGLDLITPAIRTPAGRAIGALNYEPTLNGYRRIEGFERYDGRPKPSEASYWVLYFDTGSAAFAEGNTVTGATSGATGKALIAGVVQSGSYGGGNAAGYVVLTAVSGTFVDDENLQVGGVTRARANGSAVEDGATNDTDKATWEQDAIETARALIQKPAGSGGLRGVWIYNGSMWCVRDNAGATAGVLFKATTSGWVAQSLGHHIKFTGGTAEPAAGATLTGATSGATATVVRVATRTGAWSGTAAGHIALSGITGTFQNGENLQVGGVTKCVASGSQVANALPAGGRYDFDNHNFFGQANLERMYGANGVGNAFEWDGTVFMPIFTGMTTDTPHRVRGHKNHLFLAYPGGSAQHSSIGDPYEWSPVTGAAEIAIGQAITGMVAEVADTLLLLGASKIALLYGSSSADWELRPFATESGAKAWTVQKLGTPMFMDNGGIRSLPTTNAYGDFKVGTLSRLVQPYLDAKRAAGIEPVASLRSRAKDQYRLIFSDGTGIALFIGRKDPEILPLDLGITITCACSGVDASGNDVLLVGTSDGWVYQLDAGTSFDGAAVPFYLRLPFNNIGSPTQDKRWHKATLELDAAPTTTLKVLAEYGYAEPTGTPGTVGNFTVRGGGGFWGEANWGEFYWSSAAKGRAEAHLDGIGENISIVIAGSSTYEPPHTLHGLTLHFSPRKLVR